MTASIVTLRELYSGYANARLPWNDLHAYSAQLASQPSKKKALPLPLNAAAAATSHAASHRAELFAYRAAIVPHHIMRLPDIICGTGIHARPVHIRDGNDAVAHVSECLQAPLETGMAGLAQGLFLLTKTAMGALVGALVGAAFCAGPEGINTCAATGALVSAVMFGLMPAVTFAVMLGAARAVTGITKFAVVGTFYGVGYAVGTLVDALQAQAKQQAA